MADTRVVPMRWPAELLAEVDAQVDKGGRTAFVLDAVRARLDSPGPASHRSGSGPRPKASRPGSRSAPSSEAPKPEPPLLPGAMGERRPAPPVPGHGKGALTVQDERCPHPKARRSRGQCMACFAYLDKT